MQEVALEGLLVRFTVEVPNAYQRGGWEVEFPERMRYIQLHPDDIAVLFKHEMRSGHAGRGANPGAWAVLRRWYSHRPHVVSGEPTLASGWRSWPRRGSSTKSASKCHLSSTSRGIPLAQGPPEERPADVFAERPPGHSRREHGASERSERAESGYAPFAGVVEAFQMTDDIQE